jgi:hypothetical protein
MSIWKMSPMEGNEGSEPFVRNSVAWDQLLNNLDLQTSTDSSDDNEEGVPKSRASAFSEGRQSRQDGKRMGRSISAGSRECAKDAKSPNATRNEDDGYSSEDEHDSPANQESSDSAAAAFCPSAGHTAANTKMSSTVSGVFEPIGPNDSAKSYFFINGVRHCVQDEQDGVKWGGMSVTPSHTIAMTPKRTVAELPTSPDTHQLLANNAVLMAGAVIASSDAGTPAAWVCTPKAAAQIPVPFQSPPKYDADRRLSGNYPGVQSPNLKTKIVSSPPVLNNAAYYPAGNAVPMGAPPRKEAPCMSGRGAPMPPMNAAPFYSRSDAPAGNAAPAANSIVGYIYVDNNGCLRVASGTNSPLPPAPSTACPPPPSPTSLPPRVAHRQSEAAAVFQGAASVPGMKPVRYSTIYAADGSMCQPMVPTMPVSKSPSAMWGTTKAWVFRDGRWVSISM